MGSNGCTNSDFLYTKELIQKYASISNMGNGRHLKLGGQAYCVFQYEYRPWEFYKVTMADLQREFTKNVVPIPTLSLY